MTAVIIVGFSTQLAMGRSTFYSPPIVHTHAIIFMGWVTIYLLQNIFVSSGQFIASSPQTLRVPRLRRWTLRHLQRDR